MQSFLYISDDKSALESELSNLKTKLKISQFNYFEIWPTPSIGIEEVRKLKEIATLKPYGGSNRLIILRQMDKATTEAQNALLKILEEPPPNNFIALTANSVQQLLPTIVSRCQLIFVKDEKSKDLDGNEDALKLLMGIIESSPGQRLLLAGQYSKTKEEALNLLGQFLNLLERLLYNPSQKNLSTSQIAKTLSKVDSAKRYIERNVNYKATLDILLLGFPKVK